MKKLVAFALSSAALSLLSSAAFADPVVLTVGSGAVDGTYYPVVQNIKQVCDGPDIVVMQRMEADGSKPLGGSDNNLKGILHNEIPLGIVQLDKAYLELQVNPDMPRVQALLPLHEESVHVIVPTMVTTVVKEAVKANFFGLGGSDAIYGTVPNPLRDIADLRGRTVATWGGSVTTVKILSQLAHLDLQIDPVADSDAAVAAIRSGEADAIVATVGYPAKWIEALPAKEFTLLEASGVAKDVDAVYGMSGVSYDNLGENGEAIKTLSVDAILFTRKYELPAMVNALAKLQSCVRDHIADFRDMPGMHSAWQRIDPSREIKWSNLFVAPAGTQPAAATAPATGNGG